MAFYDFGFHFIVLPVKYASYLDKSVTLRNDGLITICHLHKCHIFFYHHFTATFIFYLCCKRATHDTLKPDDDMFIAVHLKKDVVLLKGLILSSQFHKQSLWRTTVSPRKSHQCQGYIPQKQTPKGLILVVIFESATVRYSSH